MVNYRRARDGNTFFFTVVTHQRQPILCLEENRKALKSIINEVRAHYPFTPEAWVLLPDHLHCIWKLPEGDSDYSMRWGLIKKEFTKHCRSGYARQRDTVVGHSPTYPEGLRRLAKEVLGAHDPG